ncbi:MAG TPA: nucleotide-diphospho-sugar transferase [Mucilaginibacter sp.]
MFNTPVLFLIFNRPGQTQHTFDAIRSQRPAQLFIAADGPRHAADEPLTARCREIVSNVDWDCEVKTLFRTENLGCGAGPANAITWFFEQVEAGIILEDDCVPNKSFFSYCTELLEKFRNDPRIMVISGTSYQIRPLNNDTYYFSKYIHVWGWASWRRAWSRYSFSLADEDEQTRRMVIHQAFSNWRERRLWVYNMKIIVNGLDAWDYQLMYWLWKNDGLAVVPWKNMVSNIGFDEQATHTFDGRSFQANMPRHEIIHIKHPEKVNLHKNADRYERYHILIPPGYRYILQRIHAAAKRLARILKLSKWTVSR